MPAPKYGVALQFQGYSMTDPTSALLEHLRQLGAGLDPDSFAGDGSADERDTHGNRSQAPDWRRPL